MRIHERMALSCREASLRSARARRSRDSFHNRSVWSKVPPLYVPVRLSPISCEASRDLWCSIGPSAMDLFKLRTSISYALCPNNNYLFMFKLISKRDLYFRRWRLSERAATSVLSTERRGRPQSLPQAVQNEIKLGKWVVKW